MQNDTATWDPGIECAELSDVGLRRANNQDAMTVVIAANEESWRRRGHLFVVADGMGAHAAGELASKMAADIVPHSYSKRLDEPPDVAIVAAMREANAQIHARGQDNPEFRGMGTTGSSLVLLPEGALVAHVGDSRVYRLRGRQLDQLSFDHSLVWELMHSGDLPAKEVSNFVPKNIITRSLGPNPNVQVDLEGPFPLQVGDTFLLCSDGLSGLVNDEELGAMIYCLSPQEAVRTLVDLANLRGGPDNITVIVVRVNALPDHDSLAQQGVSAPVERTSRKPSPAAGALGGIALVSLLLAAILAFGGLALPALAAGGMAVIFAVAAAILASAASSQTSTSAPTEHRAGKGKGKGKGPHRTWTIKITPDLTNRLAQTVNELRDAGGDDNWNIDWAAFDHLESQARSAAEQGHQEDAVRSYARAISFMMAEVRRCASSKST